MQQYLRDRYLEAVPGSAWSGTGTSIASNSCWKDSIDHAPGAHDDIANAVSGVVRHCLWRRQRLDESCLGLVRGPFFPGGSG